MNVSLFWNISFIHFGDYVNLATNWSVQAKHNCQDLLNLMVRILIGKWLDQNKNGFVYICPT